LLSNALFNTLVMKKILYVALAILGLTSCLFNDDDSDDNNDSGTMTGTVQLQVVPIVNGEVLTMNEIYQDNFGRDYWFSTLKFYLSNISIISSSGVQTQISDIAIFDYEPNRIGGPIRTTESFRVDVGTYSAVRFETGVSPDLNAMDVTTFPNGHPLAVQNNMFWSWNTNFIFTKAEGNIIADSTIPWFVHTGTDEVYQPMVSLNKSFQVNSGQNTIVQVVLNLDELLNAPNQLDLATDGQSHTTDNLELAKAYQENLANAFE